MKMTPTQRRIQQRWARGGHARVSMLRRQFRDVNSGGDTSELSEGIPVYSGSDVTTITSDFLGDWRSNDSWQRFDMWRVRNRSRQLERGNPWCIAFKRNMLNNVLGYKGFHWKPSIVTGQMFGDTSEGEPDKAAIEIVRSAIEEFSKKENFTVRKKLSRSMVDRLLLSRLVFDGEIIIQKM